MEQPSNPGGPKPRRTFRELPPEEQRRVKQVVDSLVQRGKHGEARKYLADVVGLAPAAPAMAPADATKRFPTPKAPEHDEADVGFSLLEGAAPFSDEIVGGAGALGADIGSGFGLFGKRPEYGAFVQEIRDRRSRYEQAHPTTAALATLAGAVVPAIGSLGLAPAAAKGAEATASLGRRALATAGRIGKNTAAGAGLGAAYGAGAADNGDRLKGAAQGAAIGGLTAGAVSGVAEGVKGAARTLGRNTPLAALRPQNDATAAGKLNAMLGRPVRTMEDLAKTDVLTAMRQAGTNPAEVLAAFKQGQTIRGTPLTGRETLAELIGQPGTRLARGTHAIPSEGSAKIEAQLTARAESQPKAVRETVAQGMGKERKNLLTTLDEMDEARAKEAKPLYEKAYASPPIEDPAVLALFNDEVFQDAYRTAQRLADREGVKLPPLAGDLPKPKAPPSATSRTDGGRLRDVTKVETKSLVEEYSNLANRLDQENGRSMYSFTPDDNFHTTEDGRSVMHADITPRGTSYQAEAMRRAEQAMDVMNRIELELMRRGTSIADEMERAGMFGDVGELAGDAEFAFGANAPPEVPTAAAPSTPSPIPGIPVQGFDYVKRGLDDVIERRMKSGAIGRTEARQLRMMLQDALAKVDDAAPDYKAARSAYAGRKANEDAVALGGEFRTMSRDEVEHAFNALSPSEQEFFRLGAINSLDEKLAGVTDGADGARMFRNDLVRDKLAAIFPDEASYQRTVQRLKALGEEAQFKQTVLGGSPTARIMEETADAHAIPLGPVMSAAAGKPGGLLNMIGNNAGTRMARGLTRSRADARTPFLMATGGDTDALLQQLQEYLLREANRRSGKLLAPAARAAGTIASDKGVRP